MNQEWLNALFGGLIIGGSASLLLYLNGQVAGISGISNGTLNSIQNEFKWRIFFISGLILGGVFLRIFHTESFINTLDSNWMTIISAGILVGFGTILGSGCTSGHGVCGISRFSIRSILATIVFILTGVLTVFILKKMSFF